MFQTKIFEVPFHFLLHIWVQVDCRPISQQVYERTSRNSIREKTGCDEYLEDQLNVASKNRIKYPFDEKDGKKYLGNICNERKNLNLCLAKQSKAYFTNGSRSSGHF